MTLGFPELRVLPPEGALQGGHPALQPRADLRGLDPPSARASALAGLSPLSPARGGRGRRVTNAGASGRGGEAEQVAIRSASEHSWAAPVDINNRGQAPKKMPGWGHGREKEGICLGWGGFVGIWKNPPRLVTHTGGGGAKGLKSEYRSDTKCVNKSAEGEALLPFGPTPTACGSQASECASDWQAGLELESRPSAAADPVQAAEGIRPQFLHLHNGNPNAHQGTVVSYVGANF